MARNNRVPKTCIVYNLNIDLNFERKQKYTDKHMNNADMNIQGVR